MAHTDRVADVWGAAEKAHQPSIRAIKRSIATGPRSIDFRRAIAVLDVRVGGVLVSTVVRARRIRKAYGIVSRICELIAAPVLPDRVLRDEPRKLRVIVASAVVVEMCFAVVHSPAELEHVRRRLNRVLEAAPRRVAVVVLDRSSGVDEPDHAWRADGEKIVERTAGQLDAMRSVDAGIVAIDLLRDGRRDGIDLGDELPARVDVAKILSRVPFLHAAPLPVISKVHRTAVRHDAVELA